MFAHPHWLFIGALVLVAAAWALRRHAKRSGSSRALTVWVQPRLWPKLLKTEPSRRKQLRVGLWFSAAALLFISAAGPQWGQTWEAVPSKGRDVLFAIDVSQSMLAEDLKPSRLTRAKLAVKDLLPEFGTDRVGLIAFAGGAFLQCPLTLDSGAFTQALDALDTSIIPQAGSALAAAVSEALSTFEGSAQGKALIILSDGEDHSGSIEAAAAKAKAAGLRIYTLGVGTPAGELIPTQGNRSGYVRDASGELVQSRLQTQALETLASKTGGSYHLLAGGGAKALYAQLTQQLPKTESEVNLRPIPTQRYMWPLALAMLLLIAEWLLAQRARAYVPSKMPNKVSNKALGLGIFTAICAGILGQPTPAYAQETDNAPANLGTPAHTNQLIKQYNSGIQAYRSGNFAEAADTFEASLRSAAPTQQQRAYYNLGGAKFYKGDATLQQMGQTFNIPTAEGVVPVWEASIAAYESALQLNPEDADAAFNKRIVEERLKQLKDKIEEEKDKQNDQQNNDQNQQNNDQNQDNQNNQQNNNQQNNNQGGGGNSNENNQNQGSNGNNPPNNDAGGNQNNPENNNPQNGGENEGNQGSGGSENNNEGDPRNNNGNSPPGSQGNEENDKRGSNGGGNNNGGQDENGQGKDGSGNGGSPGAKQPNDNSRPFPGAMTRGEARRLLDALEGGEQKLPLGVPIAPTQPTGADALKTW